MSETGRIVVFLSIVLSIWTGMHAYVLWRLWDVPALVKLPRLALLAIALVLWCSYPLARILDRAGIHVIGRTVELIGASWLGVLFLLVFWIFVADLVSGFGRLLPQLTPMLRTGGAVVALLMSAIALVQGMREPVVTEHEVRLAGLPREHDGKVLVAITDVHLGTLIGERWMARQIERVDALKPDMIAVVGDLVDGNVGRVEALVPVLQTLRAPLGVWAVSGNHEFYAGLDRSIALFERAGFRVLRDAWAEAAPGLVMAGVDDLTARRQFGVKGDPIETALSGRPNGATVLLSHSPLQSQKAASLGVGLMVSGHTHEGQIWPFGYLVRLTYPLLGGRYEIGGMTAIVCRGTGWWGPPMRLWRRSEILRITLRAG